MTAFDAIKRIFNILLSREKIYCIVGQINSVDFNKRTCVVKPIDDSPLLYDVRLQAAISNTNGFCLYPGKDSFVIVAFINSTTGLVVGSTGLESIHSDCNLFEFNNGTDGMVKIVQLTDKLNNLVDEINKIKDIVNSHTHPYLNGTVAAETSATLTRAYAATTFNKSNYEDVKIKH